MDAVLRRGDTGSAVEDLQRALSSIGYAIAVDGVFGVETDAAVINLQGENGLPQDGIVGPDTRSALSASTPSDRGSVIGALLDVHYLSQRNNKFFPGTTCNVTALAMALLFLGATPQDPRMQFEDELYLALQSKEAKDYWRTLSPKQPYPSNPQIWHSMLGWLARRYGFSDRFTMTAHWSEVFDALAAAPIIMSGHLTAAGHVVLLIGRTAYGDLIVHDPWGDWRSAYRDHAGDRRVYPFQAMDRVLAHGPDEKWAHFLSTGT